MAWVYILQTENGQYYVGSTTDLDRRLRQHDVGQTATTRRLGVKCLVLEQQYQSLKDARSVERKIKNMKKKDYIEKMVKDGYIRVCP